MIKKRRFMPSPWRCGSRGVDLGLKYGRAGVSPPVRRLAYARAHGRRWALRWRWSQFKWAWIPFRRPLPGLCLGPFVNPPSH